MSHLYNCFQLSLIAWLHFIGTFNKGRVWTWYFIFPLRFCIIYLVNFFSEQKLYLWKWDPKEIRDHLLLESSIQRGFFDNLFFSEKVNPQIDIQTKTWDEKYFAFVPWLGREWLKGHLHPKISVSTEQGCKGQSRWCSQR